MLVWQDAFGLRTGRMAKFVKQYADVHGVLLVRRRARPYVPDDVKAWHLPPARSTLLSRLGGGHPDICHADVVTLGRGHAAPRRARWSHDTTQLSRTDATTRVPAVSLSGVTKDFGDVHAVRGIDLELQQGEIVAFLGPNGAGKTTTIDMVLGLSRPTTGDVERARPASRGRRSPAASVAR